MRIWTLAAAVAIVMQFACPANAILALQNATATYSQTTPNYNFSVDTAIDGTTNDDNGWAIQEPGDITQAQTAVFETALDTVAAPATLLTFTLDQRFNIDNSNTNHLIGRFRLSATTDDRTTFADGLDGTIAEGAGDVTATNWVVVTTLTLNSAPGSLLTVQNDGSILASGLIPATGKDTYTITATVPFGSITGFRLEVLEDSSLPTNGPGRKVNGNFVLTEFSVDAVAVPEVSGAMLFAGIGCVVGGGALIRRRRVAA